MMYDVSHWALWFFALVLTVITQHSLAIATEPKMKIRESFLTALAILMLILATTSVFK